MPIIDSDPAQIAAYPVAILSATGPTGPSGGPTGPTGSIGPAVTGPTGAGAFTGPTGIAGPTGAGAFTGPMGPTGRTGPAGKGSTGPAGTATNTGATGPTGLTGPAGAAANTGATGPTGTIGATGATGTATNTGATGPFGPTGSIGPTGPQGFATNTGATGPLGPTGILGPTGPNASAMIAVIDGSGATITTGLKGYVEVPFNGVLAQVDMVADRSGSIVVDLWKCTYAQFDAGTTHPTAADKITASTPPTISGSIKSSDSTLASWTTSLAAGDIIAFSVTSILNIQRVTITLKYNR